MRIHIAGTSATIRVIAFALIAWLLLLQDHAIAGSPAVYIEWPSGPTSISRGSPLLLKGRADHASGEQLVWTSDRQGPIGKGPTVEVLLGTGIHVITLSAINAEGESASATVSVTVTR